MNERTYAMIYSIRYPKLPYLIDNFISKIRYPKFLFFIITIALAYAIFSGIKHSYFSVILVSSGYMGIFITGMLFAYGFTSAPATSIFMLLAKNTNIILAGVIGGLGALIADLLIFSVIRYSFADEIEKLSKERIVNYISSRVPRQIKDYILPITAGAIIALPMPDEIGVSMLAASKNLSKRMFILLSFVLNTIGIIAILYAGRALV